MLLKLLLLFIINIIIIIKDLYENSALQIPYIIDDKFRVAVPSWRNYRS